MTAAPKSLHGRLENQRPGLLASVENFIAQYITFPETGYAFVTALWAIATHLYQHFDCTPYLCITSTTKRSGKTRLAEVLLKVVARGEMMTAASIGGLYQSIRDAAPTLFVDEAEVLGKDNAGSLALRAVLNSGNRLKGAVKRYSAKGAQWWPTYCPKGFILIGDVFDTLRDRSIVVQLLRGTPTRRYVDAIASEEGRDVWGAIDGYLYAVKGEPLTIRTEETEEGVEHLSAADALKERELSDAGDAIVAEYRRRASEEGLAFLTDREAELWCSLFAVCSVVAPDRVAELMRIAVDLAAEKTQDARRHVELRDSEREMESDEYAVKLLRDLAAVLDGKPFIYTADAIDALRAIDVAPWRKFRGDGLTAINMSDLLSRFGLAPRVIKSYDGQKLAEGRQRANRGTRRTPKSARGYRRDDVLKALKSL